eukprot:scaffold1219_cov400-Prasinococcus_capsulatus_cf.AAC.29
MQRFHFPRQSAQWLRSLCSLPTGVLERHHGVLTSVPNRGTLIKAPVVRVLTAVWAACVPDHPHLRVRNRVVRAFVSLPKEAARIRYGDGAAGPREPN